MTTNKYIHGVDFVGNSTRNSQNVGKKKLEKTHAKENNHTHKTVFTWFGNLRTSMELQGFHYYQGKIQIAATMFLTLSLKNRQHQNPNNQAAFSTSYAQDT